MDDNLHPADAALFDAHYLEGVILIIDSLMQTEEVALDFKEQTGQRVGITHDIIEFIGIYIKYLAEIAQQRLALKEVSVIVELGVGILLLVVLIINFANNLFKDVFQRDKSARATKFINHNGNMHLVFLELPQEVVNLLSLRDEIGRTDETLPAEVLRLVEIGQQVLDIEYPPNIILIILKHGDAAVIVLHYGVQHLLEIGLDINVNDVLSRCHHFFGCFVAKANDAAQHALLVLDVILIGELESLLQVINTELPFLFLHHLLCHYSTLDEHPFKRPEKLAEEEHTRGDSAAKGQRILPAVDLWHNLTEEQKDESEQHRDAEELHPWLPKLYQLTKDIVAQHDNRDVDQVVRNENGGQRALGVTAQHLYAGIAGALVGIELVEILGRETEKGNLGTTRKSRHYQQCQCEHHCDPYTEGSRMHSNQMRDIYGQRNQSGIYLILQRLTASFRKAGHCQMPTELWEPDPQRDSVAHRQAWP